VIARPMFVAPPVTTARTGGSDTTGLEGAAEGEAMRKNQL
jgi:hypothetical protein